MGWWIKLYDNFLDWEWYKNNNTKIVFLHLLMIANKKDTKFMGMIVPRGSMIIKIESTKGGSCLCTDVNLTPREVRTVLANLVKTEEISIETTNKFTRINVLKYKDYQDKNTNNDNQTTIKRRTNDEPTTSIDIELKKERIQEYKTPFIPLSGEGRDSQNNSKSEKSLSIQAELKIIRDKYVFQEVLGLKIDEWIEYKNEKRQSYKPKGLNSLLSQIEKNEAKFGYAAIIDLIDICMANNWQGLAWDKIEMKDRSGNNQKQKQNGFINFKQKEYDFDDLEKKLFEANFK